ncbi:BatD family protein [Hwangdonia lutea]|uniref:BatD family protein n=1 Tax=Hwangdonia lutea TaxID=3075823 RepID=A0AA97HRS8_9FLAO|nr:BatD family protein [Hwangdonia sp. SCSIO 19198]WOD45136.1 BatD family protein [Hwangdonia sp. SCSIO 19198]
MKKAKMDKKIKINIKDKGKKTSSFRLRASSVIFFFLCSFSVLNAQVTSAIDSTSIKIGEQITYSIQVETDSTSLVVFPEGQTFSPLEMIESYKVDTLKNNDRFNLIKKYGLTQFDSGSYTIPRQKIIIGDKTIFTDSLKVEVHNVVVDTTKQGLYDIKPIIEVDKSGSNWWKYVLLTLLIIGIIGFLIYWFIWRKKPLSEEEQIALLPPYDRAKLALKKLDESQYLEHENLKDYYSELTFIIRKYLDEKVYDRALESTTDELISRLNLLKDGNQVDISKDDIKKLESILKRADLVKFAKSAPDVELAKLDRNTIDVEIDNVKEALPEPTEEEKLLDEKYKAEQARKKKRKKVIITVAIGVFLLISTFVGFGLKYGFSYVKDTIIGHESKELLEGNWVTSAYGYPPITISTPKVLKRVEVPMAEGAKSNMSVSAFSYGTLLDFFSVTVSTTVLNNAGENNIDLEKVSENSLKAFEAKGAKDIVVLRDKFTTPNGAEGLKTHGTLKIPNLTSEKLQSGKYTMLQFASQNVLQQIIITSAENDTYADQMVERILYSVELKEAEE